MKIFFKTYRYRLIVAWIALGLMVGFFSCAGPRALYVGQTVNEEDRIALPTGKVADAEWQTKDLSIHYQAMNASSRLHITGEIQIAKSILKSYPDIEYFFFRLSFVDGQGQIVVTHNIPLAYQTYMKAPKIIKFEADLEYPRSCAAFSFSYTGQFADRDQFGYSGKHAIYKAPL